MLQPTNWYVEMNGILILLLKPLKSAIRIVKVKTKVSGQFKSLHQAFAIIHSVVGTAFKNKQTVFDAIKALVIMPLICWIQYSKRKFQISKKWRFIKCLIYF